MFNLPTTQEIRSLHKQYAPTEEAFELVYTHCVIVEEIARQLLRKKQLSDIDPELVRVGCLLHDIGVYLLYDDAGQLDHANYIKHGILGYGVLKAEGLDESLCRFCSRHTGVGLTKDDVRVQQLALPVADYLAETPEERLLMYADKFHTKTDPPKLMTAVAYANYVRRFGSDKEVKFNRLREEFGEPDLSAPAEEYELPIV
ncbi:HD domain-containing protein [Streptomyces sp. NPDC102365]|uniref:HD domain-containing protein n=1 Tax=Streptomyces sp. NPDC102365 TaxID=3366162 RepID=UPI003828A64C